MGPEVSYLVERPPSLDTHVHTHVHTDTHPDTHSLPHLRSGCFQDKEKALSEQRRYSLIDPSSAPELLRLQHQLMSTEDTLRDALDQAQQVEKLMEAMRGCPDKSLVSHGPGWADQEASQGLCPGNPNLKREATLSVLGTLF